MMKKIIFSQILGAVAAYITYAIGKDVYVNMPTYIPATAWLIITMLTLKYLANK